MSEIKVSGADWCEDTQRTRARLDELKVPYRYINVDHDPAAKEWVKAQNHGKQKTPTVDIDGKILIEPTNPELDAALQARNAG
jgi:mycoredoxin